MNTIFLIMGESGSGKDTIVNCLCKDHGLKKVLSYTTRPKRTGHERTHTFVTEAEFDQLKDRVAYTEFDGYRYAATADQVDKSDLYIIDPHGVKIFKARYHRGKRVKVIYVKTYMRDRFTRMMKRGDTVKQAIQRLNHDREAFSGAEMMADFVVYNNDLDTCLDIIWKYIQEETSKE